MAYTSLSRPSSYRPVFTGTVVAPAPRVAAPTVYAPISSSAPQRPALPPGEAYAPFGWAITDARTGYDRSQQDILDDARFRQQGYDIQVGGLQAQLAAEQGAAGADASAQNARIALNERFADEDFTRGSRINDEDFQRNLSDLARQYQFLGHSQEQRARQMGVASGGALAQSLAKRQANQEHDRQPLQIGHDRAAEALGISQSRAHEAAAADRAAVSAAAAARTAGLSAQIQAQIAQAAYDRSVADSRGQTLATRLAEDFFGVNGAPGTIERLGQQAWQTAGQNGYFWSAPAPVPTSAGSRAYNPTTRSPYAPGGRYGGVLGFPATYQR